MLDVVRDRGPHDANVAGTDADHDLGPGGALVSLGVEGEDGFVDLSVDGDQGTVDLAVDGDDVLFGFGVGDDSTRWP